MQQQTYKNYELFGEFTTTVPRKGKNCIWYDNGVVDRTGCTFTFNIRFDMIPHEQYTIQLTKYKGCIVDDDSTRNKYFYDCVCLETGHVTEDYEVNKIIHCFNNIDKHIGTFIILIGLKDKVGNGQKATDRPLNDIIRLGAYRSSYIEFYEKYTDLGYYIHAIYGLYALDKLRHSYKCYGGVHKLTGNNNILEPVRVSGHNNNSSSNGYKVLQELLSYWSPCFLLAINETEKSEYNKIRKTFEEIEVQCIRLTDCVCTNSEYTTNYNTQRQIKIRIEQLLTTEMTKDYMKYKSPLLLLTQNCRKVNMNIQYAHELDKVRYDEMTELFTKLQSPTPKEYARLIVSLCEQFKLNYNKIRDYYKDLTEFIVDEVKIVYVRGQQSSIDYNKIVEQRVEEERRQQEPIKIADVIDWNEESVEERRHEEEMNKLFMMNNRRFKRK